MLFARYRANESERYPASIKLYSCQMWSYDVLMRDFVPALNSENKYCLWDKVSETFFLNAGTGEFNVVVGENQLTTENGQGIITENGEQLESESVPYTMLDWIEGTATQWINTGIVPSSTIKIETKASGLTGGSSINGSEYTSSYRYKWGINGSNPYIGYGGSNYNISGQTVNLSTPYTYYISSGSQWIKDKDGNTIHQSTTGNLSRYSSTPIYLFACYSSSSNNIASQMMRLYYCKIWDGDTLVRDFIPVIDENNVVCLYDKVSQAYFYNQGEDSFIPSETITYKTFAYVGTNAEGYIDTGFKPDNNTRVRTEFEFLTTPTSTWEFLFGSRDNYHVAEFTCAYNSSSWFSGFRTTDVRPTSPARAINTTYRIDKNKNSLWVNGTTTTDTYGTFTGSYNMVFFGNVANGTFGGNSHAKCYYFKIYDNGTLTRDFIPVLRKSDNVPCFYDLVNNEFYTNAGTGTFLYG